MNKIKLLIVEGEFAHGIICNGIRCLCCSSNGVINILNCNQLLGRGANGDFSKLTKLCLFETIESGI